MTRLGAIDLATGQVLDWAPVAALGLSRHRARGRGRDALRRRGCGLRVFDVATRAALPRRASRDGRLRARARWRSGVSGSAGKRIRGRETLHLRHIDANGFNVPYAVTDGAVHEIEAAGAELFLAGAFSEIAGEPRWNLGSIDLSTGRATRFRPEPGTSPWMSNERDDARGAPRRRPARRRRLPASCRCGRRPRASPGSRRAGRRARRHREARHRSSSASAATGSVQWVYGGDFAGYPVRSTRAGSAARARRAPTSGTSAGRTTLRDADAGHRMRVVLVAHNDAGSSELDTQRARPRRPRARSRSRSTPRTRTCTASRASAPRSPWPTACGTRRRRPSATRWQRCDYEVGCRPIPGATGRTYTTTSADAGQRLRATVYRDQRRRRARVHRPGGDRPDPRRPTGRLGTGARSPTPPFGSTASVTSCTATATSAAQSANGRIGWLRCDASGANCTRLANEMQAYELHAGRPRPHVPSDADRPTRPAGESPESTSEPSRVIGPAYVPTPTPTPNPDPSPTPVPTPPANSWPTGTPTPVPTSTATPSPQPTRARAPPGADARRPAATASPGPTALAGPDRLCRPHAATRPDARPARPARPLPDADPLTAARRRTRSPARRARAARHRDPPPRRPRAPARQRQGHRDRACPRQAAPSASSRGAPSRSPRAPRPCASARPAAACTSRWPGASSVLACGREGVERADLAETNTRSGGVMEAHVSQGGRSLFHHPLCSKRGRDRARVDRTWSRSKRPQPLLAISGARNLTESGTPTRPCHAELGAPSSRRGGGNAAPFPLGARRSEPRTAPSAPKRERQAPRCS